MSSTLRLSTSRSLLIAAPIIATLALSVQGAQRQNPPAQQQRRDAREIGSDVLMGTWVLNHEKSHFSGPPPKMDIRTFDYTADGRVLSTHQSINAQGNRSFGHWVARLDGSDGAEFNRTAGSTPVTVVNMTLKDPRTMTISASRNGAVIWLGSFVVAEDGKTMNWKLKSTPAQTRQTEFDYVYDKEQ